MDFYSSGYNGKSTTLDWIPLHNTRVKRNDSHKIRLLDPSSLEADHPYAVYDASNRDPSVWIKNDPIRISNVRHHPYGTLESHVPYRSSSFVTQASPRKPAVVRSHSLYAGDRPERLYGQDMTPSISNDRRLKTLKYHKDYPERSPRATPISRGNFMMYPRSDPPSYNEHQNKRPARFPSEDDPYVTDYPYTTRLEVPRQTRVPTQQRDEGDSIEDYIISFRSYPSPVPEGDIALFRPESHKAMGYDELDGRLRSRSHPELSAIYTSTLPKTKDIKRHKSHHAKSNPNILTAGDYTEIDREYPKIIPKVYTSNPHFTDTLPEPPRKRTSASANRNLHGNVPEDQSVGSSDGLYNTDPQQDEIYYPPKSYR